MPPACKACASTGWPKSAPASRRWTRSSAPPWGNGPNDPTATLRIADCGLRIATRQSTIVHPKSAMLHGGGGMTTTLLKRFADLLLSSGVVTEEQLTRAMAAHRQQGGSLTQILIQQG